MEVISKIQQKYKGVRRIEKRPLISKKQLTRYPKNYVHRVFLGEFVNKKVGNQTHGEYKKYKLIYQ